MMTHREAYVFGWTYGYVTKTIREKSGIERMFPAGNSPQIIRFHLLHKS